MHHAKTLHIKPYDESVTSVTPKLHGNNTDVFAQRRNSYTKRRIMVLCRQFVDKCKQQKQRGQRTIRCPLCLFICHHSTTLYITVAPLYRPPSK